MSIPAHAEWIYEENKDRMGAVSASAYSELVSPEEPIDTPHEELQASIHYTCGDDYGALVIFFSAIIPLSSRLKEKSPSSVNMRINFDDDRHTIQMDVIRRGEPPNAAGVVFSEADAEKYTHKVMQHSSALLEVVIKDASQPAYFNFDLTGSSEVITKAQRACFEYEEETKNE